jgi:hypothetical protein
VGFDISWIAFRDTPKARVLEMLGVRDTGEVDPAYEAFFSGAELPTGWFILWANDCEYASPERVKELSADSRVLACQVDEHTMKSRALCYERGAKLWDIWHDLQRSELDLTVSGSPPQEFESIRTRLMQQQDDGPTLNGLPIDYLFDIPVETAALMCGFRHDRAWFDWGEPVFTRLEPVTPMPRTFQRRLGEA